MTEVRRYLPIALSLRSLRQVLAVLLTAMVLMQTLGLMHRVAHAQKSTNASAHASVDTSGVLSTIWAEHSNSAECQLFDQSCPDLLSVPVLVLMPALLNVAWLSEVLRERFALIQRFYVARGPPVLY